MGNPKVRVFVAGMFTAGLLFMVPVIGQDKETSEVDMRKKLEYSSKILDGLVTEDFDKVLKNAEALNKLGQRKWHENPTLEYRTQNQVFWFTAGSLVLAAKEKNIDGATLAYTQMTVSCVNCHKVIRSQ